VAWSGTVTTGAYFSQNGGVANNSVAITQTKTLAKSDSSLARDDTGNYRLVQQITADGTGTISKRTVTLTADPQSKTYDGTNSVPNASAYSVSATGSNVGFVGDEGVTGVALAYTDKNASMTPNKTIEIKNAVAKSNTDLVNNYDVAYVNNTASTISKRTLTLAAATDTKTYDGGTSSTGVVSVTNKATPDTVVATQSFTDKNVNGTNGSMLKVNAGYTIKDADGVDMSNNYNVTDTTTATGTITPRSVTLSGVAVADKTFDGTTSATISSKGTLTSGLVSGESLDHTVGAAFNTADVGTQKPVTLTAALQSTATGNSNNYSLSAPAVTASVTAVSLPIKPPVPSPLPSDGGAGRSKVVVPNPNAKNLQLAGDEEDKLCSTNNLTHCFCQESAVTSVQICYDRP
jgi:hypothetical protein